MFGDFFLRYECAFRGGGVCGINSFELFVSLVKLLNEHIVQTQRHNSDSPTGL